MTDLDVIERVALLWHRAAIELPRRQPHYRVPYATVIKGAPAVAVMREARRYLSAERRARADSAVASWHGHPAHRRAVAPFIDGDHQCDQQCEVAWLAGLLEGEGSFTSALCGFHSYPVIHVQMCTEETIRRAAALLGAPAVHKREPRVAGWRPTYTAKISGANAGTWMVRLRPLMGVRRQAAIAAALAAYRPIRLSVAPEHCVVPGCLKPHRGRGLCHRHYMSWSRDVARGRAPRVAALR